jgi:hypothetical protein
MVNVLARFFIKPSWSLDFDLWTLFAALKVLDVSGNFA